MSDDIKTVLKKYENTWLSLAPQTNIGMSPDELMGYNMGHNILTKSLADIEKYATSYPVFHDTADLGMSGSLHYWSVELDRASILSLSKQLTVDLAGTGMTDADSATLAKNLESASFSGKIGYDPADPMVSMIEGSVSLSGRVLADIATHRDKDGGSIYIGNMPDKTSIVIHYGKKENRYVFDTVLSQGTTEIGKVV